MAVFTLRLCSGSYFPFGLLAAKMVVLEFSLQTIPAFATLIVCCSIASWMPEEFESFEDTESARDDQGHFINIVHDLRVMVSCKGWTVRIDNCKIF